MGKSFNVDFKSDSATGMNTAITSTPLIFQTLSYNKQLLMGQCRIIANIRERCIHQARLLRCDALMTACNNIDTQYSLLIALIKQHNEFEQQCINYCHSCIITEDDLDMLNATIEQLTVRFNDIKQNILIQEKVFS